MTHGIDAPAKSPVLVGHPFAPMGIGEHVRSTCRALTAVGYDPGLWDIYGWTPKDPALARELDRCVISALDRSINIFHVNADEVEQALRHMNTGLPAGAYNIIYPNWELARYPAEWVGHLDRFDEVWALSDFNYKSFEAATTRPVKHQSGACELKLTHFMQRREIGIPEGVFAFLFVFDLTSYVERKNPKALLDAFQLFLRRRPNASACLVIKVGGGHRLPEALAEFKELCGDLDSSIIVIDRELSGNEIANLVRLCDCMVSLHRSEGFGRTLLEAMFLARPVIGTAYSGNMDFMTAENACLVDFSLKPVREGEYPFAAGQVWADPDVEMAVDWMIRLFDDPAIGRRIGMQASQDIRRDYSARAVGLKCRARLDEILDA